MPSPTAPWRHYPSPYRLRRGRSRLLLGQLPPELGLQRSDERRRAERAAGSFPGLNRRLHRRIESTGEKAVEIADTAEQRGRLDQRVVAPGQMRGGTR